MREVVKATKKVTGIDFAFEETGRPDQAIRLNWWQKAQSFKADRLEAPIR